MRPEKVRVLRSLMGPASLDPGAADWEPPNPFDDSVGPPFPVEALDPSLAEFVEAVAESTQTPVDMAAVMAIGAIAATISKKFRLRLKPDYYEPTNLFIAVAMAPGERKSAVFREIFEPIRCKERDLADGVRPRREGKLREWEDLKKQIDDKTRERQRAHSESKDRLDADLQRLDERARAVQKEVPVIPRLVVDDVTVEKLAELMGEQQGRICVASAEGGLFEMAAGAYSSKGEVNIDVFLKGHAGEDLSSDRITRQGTSITRAALTIVLAVQPSVLRDASAKKKLHTRGFLARFLYCIPASRKGTRKWDTRPIDPAVRNDYSLRLGRLLDLPVPDVAAEVPTLRLDSRAEEVIRQLHDHHERRVDPHGGDLADISEWAGKYLGAVGRIAAILHCWAHANASGGPSARPVDDDTLRRACRIGEFLLEHARLVFGMMAADDEDRIARRFVEGLRVWAQEHPGEPVSQRDLQRMPPRPPKREVDRALAELLRRGYLRRLPDEPARGGRKPGPRFDLHPVLRGQKDRTS